MKYNRGAVKNISKKKGFTLIEVVIVIVILSIIAAIGSRVLQAALNSYITNQNVSNANAQARLALERISRDVHNINAAANISTAAASQLSFTDINGNTVTYLLSGTQLTRTGQVLADGVSGLTFAYLNSSGGTASTIASICYVTTTLTFNTGGVNYTLRNTASAMNFC
jgi:prepilin-type N-terminal cleavage/methylation domain-containing protein